jgi:hypothetical protein
LTARRRIDPNAVTAAIFGLLGVIVGGVINGVVSTALARRTEDADRRGAARLVRSELVRFRSLAIGARMWTPEHLPQLRYAGTELWDANRAVLARGLRNEDWALVARAYAHVDAALSVLVFEPDGTLVDWRRHEAQRLLAELVEPTEQAALILGQAAGLRSEQLDEAREPDDGQSLLPARRTSPKAGRSPVRRGHGPRRGATSAHSGGRVPELL